MNSNSAFSDAAASGKPRVAYLGPPATFTHQAARLRFGDDAELVAADTIPDVFAGVEQGREQWGVAPIENSTEGAVTHTLDAFADTPLLICDEIFLPISHCLLSRESPERIRRLISHPQVFGQCRDWIRAHYPAAELVSAASTARAAEQAAAEPGAAALAGDLAAELYGLPILEDRIEDRPGNSTRFLVLGTEPAARTGRDKTSLLFHVAHRAGALVAALGAFGEHGINMTRIESRPSRIAAWEYVFFVDIEGHREDLGVLLALEALRRSCTHCAILGSYPIASRAAD